MENECDSYVSFKVISELTGREYKKFISELLFGFLSYVDPSLSQCWAKEMTYQSRWNEESGLGMFQIMGTHISHLKLYLFDENQSEELSRNIVFRDHYSKVDVEKIYLVADTFEMFLKSRRIKYMRHNRMR